MKRLLATGVTMVICFSPVFATEFTIKNGVSNWDSADSYVEGEKPGQDDVVVIPDETRVTLDAADTASWSLVGKLARIRPTTDKSALVVNVTSGSATFPTIYTMRDGGTVRDGRGKFVKVGGGTLALGDFARESGGLSGASYDYYTTLVVSNGVLKLPQTRTESFWVYRMEVVKNATLYLGAGVSYPRSYVGEGTITSELSPYSRLNVSNNENERFDFAGVITGNVRLMPDQGHLNLTGVDSDFATSDGASIGRGSVGVMKFGNIADTKSSIGAGHYLSGGKSTEIPFTVRNAGGTWRYLGSSETSDRRLTVWASPAVLDGGPHGGLTLSGKIMGYDQGAGGTGSTAMMHQLVLTGTNETPCVIAGTIPLWRALNNAKDWYTGEVTNYTFHVTKRGSGIWRFASPRRRLAGAIAVEDGTLQFDSINETNRTSAIGTASILREPYTDVWHPAKNAAPALTLGTATTAGTLEFTGTNGDSSGCDGTGFCTSDFSWTSTRPVALKGNGRFQNSTARSFRLKGVSPAAGETGAKTVTLGGTGTAENELSDISDTVEAPVKVVKEGAGTWYLGGNQSFRGGIEVKSGTLRVRKPTNLYRYYKFTTRGILGSYVDGDGTPWATACLNLKSVALYDSSNKRIALTPTWVPNVSCLTNNCVAYAENPADNSDTWTFFKWNSTNERADPSFALNATSATQLHTCFMPGASDSQRTTSAYQKCPTESDPATWVSFVWKLSDEAPEACGYDLACRFCKYSSTTHAEGNIYKQANGAGQLTSWALAGSVDGLVWDELSSVSTNEHGFASHNYWFYSPSLQVSEKDLTTVHPTTGPIASRAATKPVVFADGVRVSVANGATLEAVGTGDAVVVKGLDISSTDGLGRLNGFTLAETGTIDFDRLPKGQTTVYPGALAGCEDLANAACWTVTEGGKATTKADVTVAADGTVTVTRLGMVIIIR